MKRITVFFILLVFSAALIFSIDFGLLTEQKFEAEKKLLTYSPSFTPWLSWNGGEGLSVYLSGVLSLKYLNSDDGISENDGWRKPVLLPELSHCAFTYRDSRNFSIEAGRIFYADTLAIAASGLFDGIRYETALPVGIINAGVFYSGFLHKDTAKISMTQYDEDNNGKPWDWDHVGDYFASRRVLASLRLDVPVAELNTFTAEALVQFDVNGKDDTLHSQYGTIQFEMFPNNTIGVTVGALFEAMENGDGDFTAGLGALARVRADLPGSLNHGMNAVIKFGSGAWNDTFTAFKPVSSHAQGMVFPNTLSGLALLQAGYNVRLHQTISLDAAVRYFFRTFDDPAGEGYLYGAEPWASFTWQPLEDISFTLGGGAFFPKLGNYFPSDTDTTWNISASLRLSF